MTVTNGQDCEADITAGNYVCNGTSGACSTDLISSDMNVFCDGSTYDSQFQCEDFTSKCAACCYIDILVQPNVFSGALGTNTIYTVCTENDQCPTTPPTQSGDTPTPTTSPHPCMAYFSECGVSQCTTANAQDYQCISSFDSSCTDLISECDACCWAYSSAGGFDNFAVTTFDGSCSADTRCPTLAPITNAPTATGETLPPSTTPTTAPTETCEKYDCTLSMRCDSEQYEEYNCGEWGGSSGCINYDNECEACCDSYDEAVSGGLFDMQQVFGIRGCSVGLCPTDSPSESPSNPPTTAEPTQSPTTAQPTSSPSTAEPTDSTTPPTTNEPTEVPVTISPTEDEDDGTADGTADGYMNSIKIAVVFSSIVFVFITLN